MSETAKVEQTQDVKQSSTEDNSVPYARFKEIVGEKNEFKTKFEELQSSIKAEKEAQQLKELEAKGEYEKVMVDMKGKLEDAQTKAQAFDTYQASRRESLLSKLPEDDRAIYDGLSLEKLEVNVDKFNSKPNPAAVDNSKPNASNVFGGYDNIVEMATKDPKKAEQWLVQNVEKYKAR